MGLPFFFFFACPLVGRFRWWWICSGVGAPVVLWIQSLRYVTFRCGRTKQPFATRSISLDVCAYECDLGGGRLQIPDCTAPNSIEDKGNAFNSEPLSCPLLFSLSLGGDLQQPLNGYAGT